MITWELWHDKCILQFDGAFDIDALDLDFMVTWFKSASEHKGIKVRLAPVNSVSNQL